MNTEMYLHTETLKNQPWKMTAKAEVSLLV